MAEELSLFHEIDEALRIDRFEEFWQRYHYHVIALAVTVVLAVSAWEFWRAHHTQEQGAQTAVIIHAEQVADTGDAAAAAAAFEDARHTTDALAQIAALREAQVWVKAGAFDKAQAVYESLALDNKTQEAVRDYAALQANIIADNLHVKTGVPLPAHPSAFAAQADEVRAARLLQAGKVKEAQAILVPFSEDPDISAAARTRALELLNVTAGNSK